MYKRKSNSGHVIEWTPENEELAAEAVVKVDGTKINSVTEAKKDYTEVDKETADEIRSIYRDLISNQKEKQTS